MTSGRLILWRHGQTELNVKRRFQGHIDTSLDEVGVGQAARAAKRLAELTPTAIVSSDLTRARQTAQALGAILGLEVATDARLRERSYGEWEGLNASEIEERFPGDFERWQSGKDPVLSRVESRRAAAERALPAIEEHWGAGEGRRTVVVVSHGGLITCLVSALLGLDPSSWLGLRGLDNCHWAMLAPNDRREPSWRLLGYNRYTA